MLGLRLVDQDHLVYQQEKQDPTVMLSGLQLQMCSCDTPAIQVVTGKERLAAISEEVLLPHPRYCEQTTISSIFSAV